MAKFGYARVSTKDQNLERQIEELHKAGVEDEFLFLEKASGKNFADRKVYKEMKSRMTSADVLYVEALDRLGRNRKEILKEIEWLNENTGGLIVISMKDILKGIDQASPMGQFLWSLIINVQSYMDETERIERERTRAQGRKIAKREGRYKGRKTVFTMESEPVKLAFRLLDENKYTKREIAKMSDIGEATLYKLIRKRNEETNISISR